MSALLRLFGGNYQLYFVAFLLLALSATSSGFLYQRGEAIEYRAKVSALNQELVGAKDALAENAAAVKDLQAAVDDWKAKAEAATGREADAVKRLDEQSAQAAQMTLKLQTTERADNALPDCKKLLAMDLGAVCPGHVSALRMRAANAAHLQGPDRHGVGPDAHAP